MFYGVDPLAEKYAFQSPFAYAANNPIKFIDWMGLSPGDTLQSADVVNTFNDGKTATDYTITVYVDQPGTGGDDDTWEYNGGVDVGHTFVGLKKTNDDGTITEAIVGFYPNGGVDPVNSKSTNGMLIDDEGHNSEVSEEFTVTESQFNDALNYINTNGSNTYNLDTYNCTDFGIGVAGAAGQTLPDTRGTWLGGGGSNPGNLGQDIRTRIATHTATSTPATTTTNNNKKNKIK